MAPARELRRGRAEGRPSGGLIGVKGRAGASGYPRGVASGTSEEVARWSELSEGAPVGARVEEVDLVVVRTGDEVRVLHGRCPHRRALLADGEVVDGSLVCSAHAWDFRLDTGRSEHVPGQCLRRFRAWVDREADAVLVDPDEVATWRDAHPEVFEGDDLLL